MPIPEGPGLQVKHTLAQGRCNQIDACPGCTLKAVPGGVDKMDACPRGDFIYDFTYCPVTFAIIV